MERDYRFELYKDKETNEFVVRYFDVPVIGAGNTMQEAIDEAQGNLSFYLDFLKERNENIPEASESPFNLDYSGRITLRIPKNLHRGISFIAEDEGISLNLWLNNIISASLEKYLGNKMIKESLNKIENIVYDFKMESRKTIMDLQTEFTSFGWNKDIFRENKYETR